MHPPTPEQSLIIEAARRTSDNLLVNALAGAAKTTTLEMICAAVTGIPILSLAFNKRIADEMTKRLPSHVECRTLNALGHRVWAQATGKRLVVDSEKCRKILRAQIDLLPRDEKSEGFESFSDTLRLVSRAKREGYVPDKWTASYIRLISTDEFWFTCEEEPTRQQINLVNETLCKSIAAAYEGGIDFDDQIYMPVIFGGTWPRFPLVLVDEFQDFNPLQHEMLSKLVSKRLIAVGDPWQSIYGFRGAVANGMAAARERWGMKEFSLSVTFRVPRLGVERARSRVPHMQWRENAPLGAIDKLQGWGPDDVPSEVAIICRNNAPLLSLGFRLLRNNRAIKLVGFDIGAGLVRILSKLGAPDLNENQMIDAIEKWTQTELARGRRSTGAIYDRAECLHALTEGRKTLRDAITAAQDLFKREGPIQLMSGHKSKGLEFETVFHLDPWRVPSKFAKEGTEAWEQELNVRYVIETRFKERLVLVNLEDFHA
jgi:DNA helicase-2/ATP-dependent DNA helicase PcrA